MQRARTCPNRPATAHELARTRSVPAPLLSGLIVSSLLLGGIGALAASSGATFGMVLPCYPYPACLGGGGGGGSGLAIKAVSAFPNPVPVGNRTVFDVIAMGGYPPYSYSYSQLPPGCGTADVYDLSCTPTMSGEFNVGIHVSDSRGDSVATTYLLMVVP